LIKAFRRELSEAGYDEGRNVAIEYRWGDGYNRMAEMASDLVQRKVAALVAAGRRTSGTSRNEGSVTTGSAH
jgi:putative ABC transport system substrate-binding protein